MKTTKLGQELIAGLNDVIKHERGQKKLRVSSLEIPKPARRWQRVEIAQLRRKRFGMSQRVFASLLSVTTSTVRAWEQGLKKPSGAASRLLEVAAVDPLIFRRLAQKKSIPFRKGFTFTDRRSGT